MMTKEEFINRVKGDFPDYDFSQIKYVDLLTKVDIICFKHGLFKIRPANMLYQHQGCKFCGIEKLSKTKSLTKLEFIKRAQFKYGDIHDYSLVNYKNNKSKIKIICKLCGTVFKQYPGNYLNGYGCPFCKQLEKENQVNP